MNDLPKAIAAMSARARDLDALDDKLAKLIAGIESALRDRVSVRLEIEIHSQRALAFGKLAGKWCLILVDQHSETETAIASCPRAVRAEMFIDGHVTRLLIDADADVVTQVGERERAIAAAENILSALGGGV